MLRNEKGPPQAAYLIYSEGISEWLRAEMTEEVKKKEEGYRVWRNPSRRGEPVVYMGQFRPPEGSAFFAPSDLRARGFAPGDYTVLIPEGSPLRKFASKWQRVSLLE